MIPDAEMKPLRVKGTSSRRLKKGMVVEIEWRDCHSTDHLSFDEIEQLTDPGITIAYGVVIRNSEHYVAIASEVCTNPLSDGNWVEQIPHGAIQRVRLLGDRQLPQA